MSEWAEISRDLDQAVPGSSVFITAYVIISGFVFLNLIIALICEAMGSIHKMEQEERIEIMKSGRTLSVKVSPLDRLKYIEDTQKLLLHLVQNASIKSALGAKMPQASLILDHINYNGEFSENGRDPFPMNDQTDLCRSIDESGSEIFHDAASDVSFDTLT